MSAATLTREAITGSRRFTPVVPRPQSEPGIAQPSQGRATSPSLVRPVPTARAQVRSCTVASGATAGLGDRSLLAIMMTVALVFLFGLVVLVQGFWSVSQAPEAISDQPVVIAAP